MLSLRHEPLPRPTAPESVHAALAQLAADDPVLAARAAAVFDDLRQVNPSRVLTQFHLQLYCWLYLPEHRYYLAECWRDLEALAHLLEALGLHRYAQLVVSTDTRRVLSEQHVETARLLAERLIAESGVEPPDTEDIVWGNGPSERPEDLLAQIECTLALETAIEDFTVDPASSDFTDRAQVIVTDVLRGDHGVFLRAVGRARFSAWTARLPPSYRRDALGIAEWLPMTALHNPDFEAGPLRWLLTELADSGPDGLTLTAAGNLPPDVVHRAVGALDLLKARTGINVRQSDFLELRRLRRIAAELGFTRLDEGSARFRLLLTARGRMALMSRERLYRSIVRELIPEHGPAAFALEVACLVGWRDDQDGSDLYRRAVAAIGDPAWQSSGRPSSSSSRLGIMTAKRAARLALERLHSFGVIRRAPGPPNLEVQIASGGSEVMFAALRHRLLRYPDLMLSPRSPSSADS